MQMLSILEVIIIILCTIHFAAPLTYYVYMKTFLKKPWNVKLDSNYKPKVTVILPTYNEKEIIEKKLKNFQSQDYPHDLIETIVIDSASTNGTPENIEKWVKKHKDLKIILIREKERKGKAHALNNALKHAAGEIVIIADADAMWPNNAITEAVKWLADPTIGAVSCLKKPEQKGPAEIEQGYRKYYNTLRISESKAWSTPIFHGELAAYRKELLDEIGGFPEHIGADDSHSAVKIALLGYRTITPETLWCTEAVPRKGYHLWRIRRAQHLIQHFLKTRTNNKIPKKFKTILHMETFLHVVNPWLLLFIAVLLPVCAIKGSTLSKIFLVSGVALLMVKSYRTWITQQMHLITASVRNLKTKEIVWRKDIKYAKKVD
nr:glycosyltransferase [Candidatus Baldrarchaeota archaeon]